MYSCQSFSFSSGSVSCCAACRSRRATTSSSLPSGISRALAPLPALSSGFLLAFSDFRSPDGSRRLGAPRRLGGGSAGGFPALVRALSLDGGAARCGCPARIALLCNPLLFGAQLGIEGAERIIEPPVDRRLAFLRSLSRSVCARGSHGARSAARRRGVAGYRVTGGAGARRGGLRCGCPVRAALCVPLPVLRRPC